MIICLFPKVGFTQLVHFTKQFKLEDGLIERSIGRIIRDDQGKIWLFSRNHIQIFDGSKFQKINQRLPFKFEGNISINKINAHQIVLQKDTKLWVLNTITKKINPLIGKTGIDFIVSGDFLYEYNKTEGSISADGKRLCSIENKLDIKSFYRHENAYSLLTKDSTLYYHNQDLSMQAIGKADNLVGMIKDSLVALRNDSLYFYQPKTGFRYKKPARFALLRKDKKGNNLLGLSFDARRITEFELFTTDATKSYTEICQPINTIRDIYGDDFRKEVLIASYNGLIYKSFSEDIELYAYNKDLSSANFGQVIWWIIKRETTGDVYFSKEVENIFVLRENKITEINPYKNSSKEFTSNYFGHYHSPTDKLYALSFYSDHTLLHIWDFENDPLDIKLPGRYYSITTRGERFLMFGGSLNGEAHTLIFDTKEKRIVDQNNIDYIGSRINHCSLHNGAEYIASTDGTFKVKNNTKNTEFNVEAIDTVVPFPSLILLDNKNELIIGTDGSGLIILKNDTLHTQLTETEGLVGNTVHCLQRDAQGNIWAGSLSGISVLDSNYQLIKNLRYEDGLGSSELNMKSLLYANEKIYAGTINGISEISNSILEKSYSYPLILEQISSIDAEGHPTTRDYIESNEINIDLGIDSIELVFHDYQLYKSYFNKDYLFKNSFKLSSASKARLKDNVLPIYLKNDKVEVTHSNSLVGFENKIMLDKELYIEKYGIIILGLFLIFMLLWFLYLLNRKRKKEQQEQKLKSLEDSLDAIRGSALRAQMNPHFIFNALGSIQYYIQRQETEKAEEYLTDFSTLMRSTLESSAEDYTKISRELEMIRLYLKLEHLRFEEKFEYKISIDEQIDETLEIPSMLIQPFIENAINHGIYHLTERKGLVELNIYEKDNETIICEIIDNGVGREKAKLYRKKRHKSRALSNIRERIEIMNSLNNNQMKLSINDRLVEGKKEGTIVKICLEL